MADPVIARARALSDELDREGIALEDQVAICGSVLTAALACMSAQERRALIAQHVRVLRFVLELTDFAEHAPAMPAGKA